MQDLIERAARAIENSRAHEDPDYPLYHVAPPVGRLNDPNGLIVDGDTYHAFYQFGPFFPHKKTIYWGHAVSTDLLHWEDRGPAVIPDSRYDRDGAYSGTGLIIDDDVPGLARFALFYTGNYKDSQTGEREATQCLVTSDDLVNFEKYAGNPIIPDQPEGYTAHYRDPQVWRDADGSYRMLIGVQRENLTGTAVFYRSDDLREWRFEGEMTFPGRESEFAALGYMWECPNLVSVADEVTGEKFDLLVFCPQGVDLEREGFENIFPCVYLLGHLEGNAFRVVSEDYIELDRGFEFYAPQVFARRRGDSRVPLLAGWAGNASEDAQPSLKNTGWVHTLTVPRELTVREGRVIQRPAPAWGAAAEGQIVVAAGDTRAVVGGLNGSRSFRLEVAPDAGMTTAEAWGVRIGGEASYVAIELRGGQLIVDRSTTRYPHGDRRIVTLPEGTASRLEILHDRSITEIYVGDGDLAFTLRSYLDAADFATTLFVADATVAGAAASSSFTVRYQTFN
ncbi:MAG: glycoside hydrolase family 32 protein [Ancrocorticia sp.]